MLCKHWCDDVFFRRITLCRQRSFVLTFFGTLKIVVFLLHAVSNSIHFAALKSLSNLSPCLRAFTSARCTPLLPFHRRVRFRRRKILEQVFGHFLFQPSRGFFLAIESGFELRQRFVAVRLVRPRNFLLLILYFYSARRKRFHAAAISSGFCGFTVYRNRLLLESFFIISVVVVAASVCHSSKSVFVVVFLLLDRGNQSRWWWRRIQR